MTSQQGQYQPTPQTLLLATSNAGKLREFRTLLADLPVNWLSLSDVNLNGMVVEETGETFTANALLKAQRYSEACGLPTLADDSGIVVDALNGAPGVYSARYAPTEQECNTKLLNALVGIPSEQRTARYVAVLALIVPDQMTVITEGRIEGRIGFSPRGVNGFGYDPIFVLDDQRTMAELAPTEKNVISHRGRALIKLQPLLPCLFGQ